MASSTKELIKTELDELKKLRRDRRTIERDLGYSEFYLDQILSKGGNEIVLDSLRKYKQDVTNGYEENTIVKFEVLTNQQATIDRVTRMLEKEQAKNHELQDKVFELQNRLIEMNSNKSNRRSA